MEWLGAYRQTAKVDGFLHRRWHAQRLQFLKCVARYFVSAEIFTLLRKCIQRVTYTSQRQKHRNDSQATVG